jgi:hypothetical protein
MGELIIYLDDGERLDLLLPQDPRERVDGRRFGGMLPKKLKNL